MTALVILAALFIFREIQHMHAEKRHKEERKDLYTRLQAGTLQEYQVATAKPNPPAKKDREQKVAEEMEKKGVTRGDLQYPSMWR